MRILAACCAALALLTVGPVSSGAPAPGATHTLASRSAPGEGLAGAGAAGGTQGARGPTAASGFVPPLARPLTLTRAFDPPSVRWGAGHRGVDLRADVGAQVRAPGGGTVTFAGEVAGRGVVTVTHPGGLRSSVEPLVPGVAAGAAVTAGDVIGALGGAPSHCAPSSCLHWGVRDAHGYVDPLLLLAGGPTILLPDQ